MKGNFNEQAVAETVEQTTEATEQVAENADKAEKKKPATKATKNTSDKPKNIFQKMLAIEQELAVVAKNLTVSAGKNNSYKAVSERDVIDAVKPLEAEYGIYSFPVSREVIESNLLENTKTYNGDVTKTTTFMTRIKTVYRFVNVDNPDEFIETTVFSEGIDTQDKGSGKAMTYGDKYALMKMYKISTGDDPDAVGSDPDNNYSSAKKTGGWGNTRTTTPTNDTPAEQKPASQGGSWGGSKKTETKASGWGKKGA